MQLRVVAAALTQRKTSHFTPPQYSAQGEERIGKQRLWTLVIFIRTASSTVEIVFRSLGKDYIQKNNFLLSFKQYQKTVILTDEENKTEGLSGNIIFISLTFCSCTQERIQASLKKWERTSFPPLKISYLNRGKPTVSLPYCHNSQYFTSVTICVSFLTTNSSQILCRH
jgi:hypothetical protein